MTFTAAQTHQLLQAINPRRVMRDGKGNSHLPQQDVLAHLNRIFGFGGFDYEMLSLNLIFEQPTTSNDKKTGKPNPLRYDCCYKATMRLTIRDVDGNTVCKFEDGSTGDAQNQTRADAHDLAMKSAISLAKKRCAIALGDQFGLSLYNKGQLTALVGDTLVKPDAPADNVPDVQADVPEPKSMGHDEIDRPRNDDEAAADADSAPSERSAAGRFDNAAQPQQPQVTAKQIKDAANAAENVGQLGTLWGEVKHLPEDDRDEVYNLIRQLKADMLALAEANTAAAA
ncbi:Rad52/Rad22 family DNA repair protein [Rhodococcus opacus]|uniref:Rad52/Rad22 family DNA repair protein n=1 Tax=Rhodococcus opacus TaxID=37919 RepID=UPI001C49169B|nr:Rad52/Rad22 family DNA repair protein [Rhodococcus opacus]MBV6758417.1 RAD52 family DNA repair protein [Rhodococcus opacus]